MDKDIDEIVARRLNARGISCGYRSESLDKSGLVRFHYAAEKEFKKFVDETGCSATNPFFCRLVDQSNPIVSPLNTLEKIKFRDIDLTEFRRKVANRVFVRRLTGRMICGRLCVKPFKTAGVHTVLEEEGESGAAVLVLIDNAVTSTASDADIQAKFPEGMKVAIKEPVLRELWEDGTVGVNITNPADIVPLGDSASAVPGSMLSAEFLQQEGVLGSSEAIRIRGNAHFAQKNWKKAAEAYKLSAGFLEAYEQKTHSVPTVDPVILQEKLTIAYSNRCEALLRIESYKQALNDVQVALKLNPTHEKSLLRMARSLQGMQRYEEAITCLEVLRALKSPVTPDRHILATIRDSEVTSRQIRSGIYHFDDFIEVFEEQKEAPACAQFVGPIEIRVGSEHGRRGMFATRDVVPVELLLVSKAIATTKEAEVRTGPRVYFTWGKFVSQPGCQAYPAAIDAPKQDVVVKVIARAQESPQVAAQINSLQGGEASNDIPPVTLFTEDWDGDKYPEKSLDVGRIRDSTLTNMFTGGVYGLASFFNHSCAPNCKDFEFGEALFISSTRPVRCGEELTISYFKPWHTLLFRRAAMLSRSDPFQCECPRCRFEEKAYSGIPALGDLARTFNQVCEPKSAEHMPAWKNVTRPMVRESAEIAGKLEYLLKQSKDCALFSQKQRDWIRCSFSAAYMPAYFVNGLDTKLHLDVDELLRIVSSADPGSPNILALAALGYDGALGEVAARNGTVYFSSTEASFSEHLLAYQRQGPGGSA